MSRLIKKKIINYLISKGKKNVVERLLKGSIKKLNQQSKKQFKSIAYLSLNYSLSTFKLETKKVKLKKIEKIKLKPFFLFKHQNRIFYSIKIITKLLKKKGNFLKNLKNELLLSCIKKGDLITQKNENQEKVLLSNNVLTFYRYHL